MRVCEASSLTGLLVIDRTLSSGVDRTDSLQLLHGLIETQVAIRSYLDSDTDAELQVAKAMTNNMISGKSALVIHGPLENRVANREYS